MFFKISKESGRTMLEMISLLAIMGILTIGAFAWYGRSINKLHLNNLLEELRKIAVLTQERSSRLTRNIYKDAGVTAYGYGLPKKSASPKEIEERFGLPVGSKEYHAIKMKVGAINGGKGITKGLCEALMAEVYDPEEASVGPTVGSVLALYQEDGKKNLSSCGTENPDGTYSNIPETIWIAIKM